MPSRGAVSIGADKQIIGICAKGIFRTAFGIQLSVDVNLLIVSWSTYVECYRYMCPLILRYRTARIKGIVVGAYAAAEVYLADIAGIVIDAKAV